FELGLDETTEHAFHRRRAHHGGARRRNAEPTPPFSVEGEARAGPPDQDEKRSRREQSSEDTRRVHGNGSRDAQDGAGAYPRWDPVARPSWTVGVLRGALEALSTAAPLRASQNPSWISLRPPHTSGPTLVKSPPESARRRLSGARRAPDALPHRRTR